MAAGGFRHCPLRTGSRRNAGPGAYKAPPPAREKGPSRAASSGDPARLPEAYHRFRYLCSRYQMSVGELMSVTTHTLRKYVLKEERFCHFCTQHSLNHLALDTLQSTMVQFFNHLVEEQEAAVEASTSLAAIVFFRPSVSARDFTRVHRILRGMKRRHPDRSRLPLGDEVVAGLVAAMWAQGNRHAALAAYLCTVGYFRPGELCNILVGHVAPPAGGPQVGLQAWSITVCPEEDQRTSKTGATDDTILLDQPHWIGPLLQPLTRGRPLNERLFGMTLPQFTRQFHEGCRALKLNAHPYQLRHSGASSDLIANRRSPQEAASRGRWRTLRSLQRYTKTGGLQRALHRIAPPIRRFCQESLERLEQILNGQVVPVLPDFSAFAEANVVR